MVYNFELFKNFFRYLIIIYKKGRLHLNIQFLFFRNRIRPLIDGNQISVYLISVNNVTTKLVPLTKLLQQLFKLPQFVSNISNYETNNSGENIISNYIQSPHWKTKLEKISSGENYICWPLLIYFDDFEPLNALRSQAGAYYIYGVRQNFGNSQILSSLITELN